MRPARLPLPQALISPARAPCDAPFGGLMRSQSLLKFALLLAFVTALAAGCGKNSNKLTDPTSGGGASGSSVEQAGVQDAMASEPTLVEDGVYDDEDPATLGSDGG